MPALIVIGCIVLLIVLLLVIPVSLTIAYHTELSLSVRVFGIPFRLIPKKQKTYNPRHYTLKKIRRREEKEERRKQRRAEALKRKKRKQLKGKAKKDTEKKKEKEQPLDAKQTVAKVLEILPLVGRAAKQCFFGFLKKLRIRVMKLHIRVGSEDAANTAIQSEVIRQSVALLMAGLKKFCRLKDLKKADILIVPDYSIDKTEVDIHVTFQMSLGNMMGAFARAGFTFLSGWIKDKDKPKGGFLFGIPLPPLPSAPVAPVNPCIPVPPAPPSPFEKSTPAVATEEAIPSDSPSKAASTENNE